MAANHLSGIRTLPEDFAADAKAIANWYGKSSDRIRNPVQLKGFNDMPKKILTFLNEQMISIDVPQADIELFINRFRDHISKNPSLNKEGDSLPIFLEFYFKSGDYYLVFEGGKSIVDLFLGFPLEAGRTNELVFSSFEQHFGQLADAFIGIEFQKYFYLGLNHDKNYQRWRRPSKQVMKGLLDAEDSKNITPYAFMKELNEMFDKKTVGELDTTLAQAEDTPDSTPALVRYSVTRELIFIRILLLMIKHLQKYINLGYYSTQASTVLSLVPPLVTILKKYTALFNRVSSKVALDNFTVAHKYIDSFKSTEDKLTALEIFFKKLQKCKEQSLAKEYKKLSEFWDEFDLYSIDAEFEEAYTYRSYKYRSDFSPMLRKIGGKEIDNVMIYEIDAIFKEKKIPFSFLINYLENPALGIKLSYFFKQLKDTIGYDLLGSASENRIPFLTIIKQEDDKLYKFPQAKPYEDEFEQRWAEEVPLPLKDAQLGPTTLATSIDNFQNALSRFKGFPFVEALLTRIEGIVKGVALDKKNDLVAVMKEYEKERPRLVTEQGTIDSTIKTENVEPIYEGVLKEQQAPSPPVLYTVYKENRLQPPATFHLLEVPCGTTPAAVVKISEFQEINFANFHVYDENPCYIFGTKFYYKGLEAYDAQSQISTMFVEDKIAYICYVAQDGSQITIVEYDLETNITNTQTANTLADKEKFKNTHLFKFAKRGNFIYIVVSGGNDAPSIWTYEFTVQNSLRRLIEFPALANFSNFHLYAAPTFFYVSYYDGSSGKTTILHVQTGANERIDTVAVLGNQFQIKRMLVDTNNKMLILISLTPAIQPTFIKLYEVAIRPPLTQPPIPVPVKGNKGENKNRIDQWWGQMAPDSLFTDKLKEYKRAMKKVNKGIGIVMYPQMLTLLETMDKNKEFTEVIFRNIYLPMLYEWYTYCETTDVEPVVGGQRGGGGSKLVQNFIKISTKDNKMKENLTLIANNPKRDYKELVQYYQDPLPELRIERAMRR